MFKKDCWFLELHLQTSTNMTEELENLPSVDPPPFYAPFLWPFLYVYKGIRLPDRIRVPKPISLSHLGVLDTIFAFVASVRSFLLAYAIVYWLHDEKNPYPAWSKGKKPRYFCQLCMLINNFISNILYKGYC